MVCLRRRFRCSGTRAPRRLPEGQRNRCGATVFYQASLNQIFATRGQGKSIVTNALLRCLIGGEDFLRLTSDGDLNVLLVDGELPSVQLQERLKQFGDTGQLTILSPYLMSDPKEFPNLSQAADQQKFLDRIADLDAQVIHPEPSVRIVGIEPEAASQCVEDNGIEGQMSEPMRKRDDGIA